MKTRITCYQKLGLTVALVLILKLMNASQQAYAQWPPFSFDLKPSYAAGQLTYLIKFSGRVDWRMADVTVKIPLPDGTRYLEAGSLSTTEVHFDGAEVTFFTRLSSIRDAYFVVEVTDPEMTVFTTHAWISWGGDQPGDYLTRDVSLDTTLQPLNWEKPRETWLQLEARAMAADDQVTYAIYPVKNTGNRLWDVIITAPLPEGTTFLEVQAPPPFVAGFDGREVSFSAVELGDEIEAGPLSFTVYTQGATAPLLLTQAWATWKNVGRKVGQSIALEEVVRTGDILVQPGMVQWAAADRVGDVPFANYDLTTVAFQQERSALKVIFYTAGEVGPVGERLEYTLFIDNDCRADTGKPEGGRGVEYQVQYRHDKAEATIDLWDADGNEWSDTQSFGASHLVSGNTVAVWVPYELLEDSRRFCWVVEAKNKTKGFESNPPTEHLPDSQDLRIAQYEALATAVAIDTQPSEAESPTDAPVSESSPTDLADAPVNESSPPDIANARDPENAPIDASLDTTPQPLNWEKPSETRLQLEARAMVADDQITYAIYPLKNTGKRLWDVRITAPLPEGTTLLGMEARPPFVAGFDGREVSFSALELGEALGIGPLSFTISTQGTTAPSLVTHASVGWWDTKSEAGQNIAPGEVIRTGDIVVRPDTAQWVVTDMQADVPFSSYDLVSVALQPERSNLKVMFYLAGDVGPVGQPLEYILYIDNDCRSDTGKPENERGVEQRVRYRHDSGETTVDLWDAEGVEWSDTQSFEVSSLVSENTVAVWVPYELLEDGRRFCWVVEVKNKSKEFDPRPPTEHLPDSQDLRITQYEALATGMAIDTQPSEVDSSADAPVNESGPTDIANARDPEDATRLNRSGPAEFP